MAESCSSVTFVGLFNDSVYFKGDETDYCSDAFTFSREITNHLCVSLEHKFLILNPAGQLEIKNLTTAELLRPGSKFNIKIYNDLSMTQRKGRAVMLYANNNGKTMVVCCSNNEIQPKEMDPPQHISEVHHQALFYLTKLTSSPSYMFESTLHRNNFLALEHENDVLKLVLREKKDEVDEFLEFKLS